jgi:hypothetical protein
VNTNSRSAYGLSGIAGAIHSAMPFVQRCVRLEAVQMLGEVGAYGVNFHDNDLVPIDASPQERDRIVGEFRRACEERTESPYPWPPSIFFMIWYFGWSVYGK